MGAFRSPWLRAAFHAVDRTHFIPPRFWILDTDENGLHQVIDRSSDPDAWLRAVWETHRSVIVQMNDGHTADQGPARGEFSSSVSAMDIVFEKLNQLDLEPHHKVLEVGTGSGCNTAYLCQRVGPRNVTSVEVDPTLAEQAVDNLKRAGYEPETVCGDGLAGWAGSAPYDRIINTASVRHIPTAWRSQCRDGGTVLTPFNTLFARGGLLKLRVLDRVASGRFTGGANYMWIRSQRPANRVTELHEFKCRASPVDPAQVLGRSWAQDFVLGLHVPDMSVDRRDTETGRQAQLWDEAGSSVTVVRYTDWWQPDAVTVWGERDLWADLVTAFTAWRTAGQPHYTRYGLTIDDAGARLWLDSPDQTVSLPNALRPSTLS